MKIEISSLRLRQAGVAALLSVAFVVLTVSCRPLSPGAPMDGASETRFVVPPDGAGFYVLKDGMVRLPEGSGEGEFRVYVERAGESGPAGPVALTALRGGEEYGLNLFVGYLGAGDVIKAVLDAPGKGGAGNEGWKMEPRRQGMIAVAALPAAAGGEGGWFYQAGRGAEDKAAMAQGGGLEGMRLEGEGAVRVPLKADSGAKGASALVGFRVPHSGFYAVHDGVAASVSGAKVRAELFAGGEERARLTKEVSAKGASLNAEIGYLAKGERVEILLSSESATEVELRVAIVEWAPRGAPLRVVRGADGYLNVSEPAAPLALIDVPPSRWVEVPAMEEDATEAIREGFREAARRQAEGGGYAGVRLARGARYVIASRLAPGSVFEFANARQILLDGNGATFSVETKGLIRGLYTLFRTSASEQLVFADLRVEAPYRPYTIGTVREVSALAKGNQTVTFEIAEGALDPIADINPSKATAGYLYDPAVPGRLAKGAWNHYPPAPGPTLQETAAPRVFTHTVTRTNNSLATGAKWLVKNKKAGVMYLTASGSSDITLSGIDALACGGGLVRFWSSTRVNVLGCRFEPEGEGWVASTSDGIHGRGREGVWVEDTVLRGICEDMMNVYTTPLVLDPASKGPAGEVVLRVLQKDPKAPGGNRTKALEAGGVLEGDELVFFDANEGVILGTALVRGVEGGRVKLSSPITGTKPWGEGVHGFTTVYNRNTVGPVVVRDSSWSDSLRFGVFLKASGAVFFNNRFEGLANSALFAANEPEWPEGPFPENIWLEGNTFRGNNFAYPARHRKFLNVDPADVSIYLRRLRKGEEGEEYLGFLTRRQYPCSNIRIVGNTFDLWRGMGVAIRNARNVVIENNEFLAPAEDEVLRATLSRDPLLSLKGRGRYAAIFLDAVSGARIINNRFAILNDETLGVVSGEDVRDVIMDGSGPAPGGGASR